MAHTCGACDGSGECQNSFHDSNPIAAFIDDATQIDCPACGEATGDRGNCSVCGGSGEQDD
jgi:hypothetical protein